MDIAAWFIEDMKAWDRVLAREGIAWGEWMLEMIEDLPAELVLGGYR